MSIDYYVNASAGGAGVGSQADPWDWAQAVAAINGGVVVVPGDRVNLQNAGGIYSISDTEITSGGGAYQAKMLKGCTSVADDGGKATLQRSGGAAVLLKINVLGWIVKNLIIDGQDSGTINLQLHGRDIAEDCESYDAGASGFYAGHYINCHAHDNGNIGFYNARVNNCISVGNTSYGMNGCTGANCISKGNTRGNYYISVAGWLTNCISDGGVSHGFEVIYGCVMLNCIAINSPVGKNALEFVNDTVDRGSNTISKINFYGNGSDSNKIAFVDDYYELDPQFNDPDNLDYTRTGDNLNRLGFSEIGMLFDYDISIGPDSIVEDLPVIGNVRDGIDFDFARLTGVLDLPSINDVEDGVEFDNTTKEGNFEAPSESNVRNGIDYGSLGAEFEGNVELPTEAEVESGVGFGANGTEFEGALICSVVETPIQISIEDDAVDLLVADDRILLEVTDG